ncbi:Asp-tRNA(Asn)/Glu-tRNA(Gln) amidotransferase subunit GatA [Candidatus Falkowbacteria bacterium]|nr:Asp-tRNA(Asn)/Glu-tRNA(Gln) amidotransferase subunit GatA [Candidatus Falkowbacteria bacterium]
MPLNELTIKQALEKLDKGEITSVKITKACLDRIAKIDSEINACLTICEQEALQEAEEADKRRAKGEKGGLLGIPYAVKDNILTKGIRTTAGSKILDNYISPFDATVVKKLREAGAVLIAKTNMDEFGHGGSTQNSAYGVVHNPYNKQMVAGGSSGGSAAAVAADMCIFALGTDTGGSIRCPASFCSVAGLKPTYGRNSRYGLMAMTSSTDTPGILAKSSEDTAMVMNVIAGHDTKDASSLDEDVADHLLDIDSDIKGIKIGLPDEYFKEGLDEEVRVKINEAIDKFKEMGAEVLPISLPHTKYSVPVYYIITPSEISSNMARFDGIKYGFSDKEAKSLQEVYLQSRGQGLGTETKRRIMIGTYALSAGYREAYYLKAQKVRTLIKEEMDAALKEVDILLTPVQPTCAYEINAHRGDPLAAYLEDIYVSAASLSGVPALSLPCGFSPKGLPIGMQLIGKRLDESKILNIAHQYQKATDFAQQKPEI